MAVNRAKKHTMSELPRNVYEDPLLRNRTHVFAARQDAGAAVAKLLETYAAADAIIFAIPAGGVPVAVEAAERLGLPLDVLVVSKITLPWNTEAGYGAVTSDGTYQLNEQLVRQAGLDEQTVQAGIRTTREKVSRRTCDFRELLPKQDVRAHTAIVVDDGLASGFTMRVAVQALRNQQAASIVVAVPTAHLRAVTDLAQLTDAVYCANIRAGLQFAVADAYTHWSDIGEDEVKIILSSHAACSWQPDGHDDNN